MQLKDKKLFHDQCFINGAWVAADNGQVIGVNNPATLEKIGTIPNLGQAETKRAIEAAHAAFPAWSKLTAEERSKILKRWTALMIENIDDLCYLLTIEQGKPLSQAKAEIMSGIGYVDWMAEECKRVYGDIIPTSSNNTRLMTFKQPVGVCVMITPWNFPSSMITRKAGPALAAGCTVVLKPSEFTPYSALALAELAERAGIPKGVFNIVLGDAKPIGAEMTSNPLVKKLSFTGSTAVGKMLMAQCATTVKRVSLELGGNAPFIVFDDADVDEAVKGAILSKFRNSGQTCVCANRIFVHEGIYDAFTAKFTEVVKNMKIGNGLEEGVEAGPLINEKGLDKVEQLVGDAKQKGGKIITGGQKSSLGGTFYEPTVIADATKDMRFFKEEIFGPVAPLFKFKTDEESIQLANDTEYGLAGFFYSKDLARIWRAAEALQYGMIGVNSIAIVAPQAPFGGMKESGMGREGSKYGIDEYLDIKLVVLGGM